MLLAFKRAFTCRNLDNKSRSNTSINWSRILFFTVATPPPPPPHETELVGPFLGLHNKGLKRERKEAVRKADDLLSSSKVSQFARKGHYTLDKARGDVDGETYLVERLLKDPNKVQMKYMNGYLN